MTEETAIVKFKSEAGALAEFAENFQIVDDATRKRAAAWSLEARAYIKSVEDYFKEDIKRANALHKSLTKKRADLIAPAEAAKKIMDEKIKRDWLDFQSAYEATNAINIQKALSDGDNNGNFVLAELETEPEKSIRTENGSMTIRKSTKIRALDALQIANDVAQGRLPVDFLIVDCGAAKRYFDDHDIKSWPGFEFIEDAVITGRT